MKFYKVREELISGKSISNISLKVTFYARVSTESDEQLNSLDNQIEYFKEYIKGNSNWTYVEGYIDEGISGSSVKNRKQFLKMIEDAKKGMFNLIITKEVSRFSRNLSDSIKYTQELMNNDVGVYFQLNGINTYDINSEFILNMMGSVAQEEVKRLSERIKWGHNKAIKKGRVLGSNRITGYTKDNATLVIDEEQAKFVRLVYEMYATGQYGFSKLSKVLFDMGYKNRKSKIYDKCTLQRMIQNPKYKGYYRGGTTKTIDYRTKKREYVNKDDWIVFKDENVPSIVSEELWNKANDLLKARSTDFNDHNKTTTSNFRKYAYSGKIYCKEHNQTFQRSHGSRKKNRPIWACGYYMSYRVDACESPIIAEIDLDNIIRDVMKEVFENKNKIVEDLLSSYSEIDKVDSYESELQKNNFRILELKEKKEKLLELTVSGHMDNNEFENRNNKYNKDILDLELKSEKLKSEQRILNSSFTNIKILEQEIKTELDFKDNLYDFVTDFLDEIIISKNNNDRKNIKLNIFINLNKKIISNKRGSKHLEIEESPIIEKSIESLEQCRNDFKINKFNYSLYTNDI